MSRAYSITKKGKLLKSSFKRFQNWGMIFNGWFLTANFSEFPRIEKGCSLSEVLEEQVDQKYYLSDSVVQKMLSRIEKNKKNILVGGKAIDIGSAMNQAITSIADVIVDESNRLLSNLPPDAWIEKVIVCGGGAYVFGDYLKQAFFDANIVKKPEEVLTPPDAVMSNAIGFEMIASTKLKK